MIKSARYLGAKLLEKVIYTYLGNKFIIPLGETEKQKALETHGIKRFNKFELAGLKTNYIPFF